MIDPRDKILDLLDLDKTQVLGVPGFIFLCGGLRPKSERDLPTSAREHFYRRTVAKAPELKERIIFAEDVNNWSDDGVYKELFTLEQHLAALASVIVLFVESPGSIAELGAFSALSGVSKKLLVFIREDHFEKRSFITLGPIRYLKHLQTEKNNPVRVYQWMVDSNQAVTAESMDSCFEDMYDDLVDAQDARLNKSFDKEQQREQMLLIHALVVIMMGLSISELNEYLNRLGIEMDRSTLKQYLLVLMKLNLIKLRHRSKNHYYVATAQSIFLRIRQSNGDVLNLQRSQYLVSEYYRNENKEQHRRAVLTEMRIAETQAGLESEQ